MRNKHLTKANIQRRADAKDSEINLNITIPSTHGLKNFPFLLIIQSTIKEHIKLTIYPIYRRKIIKLSIFGQNVSDEGINNLLKILKKYEIIHSSGFLMKQKQFIYECYFNLSLADVKSKDLKASLDNINNIFNEIKIEEIGLN